MCDFPIWRELKVREPLKISVPVGEWIEGEYSTDDCGGEFVSFLVPSWNWIAAAALYCADSDNPLEVRFKGTPYYCEVKEIIEEPGAVRVRCMLIAPALGRFEEFIKQCKGE